MKAAALLQSNARLEVTVVLVVVVETAIVEFLELVVVVAIVVVLVLAIVVVETLVALLPLLSTPGAVTEFAVVVEIVRVEEDALILVAVVAVVAAVGAVIMVLVVALVVHWPFTHKPAVSNVVVQDKPLVLVLPV